MELGCDQKMQLYLKVSILEAVEVFQVLLHGLQLCIVVPCLCEAVACIFVFWKMGNINKLPFFSLSVCFAEH